MLDKLNEIRRANLRQLQAKYGGPTDFAKLMGYKNSSFLVQMTGPSANKSITDKTVQLVEEKLGLPKKWMDQDHSQGEVAPYTMMVTTPAKATLPAPAPAAPQAVNTDLIRDVVLAVCTEAEKMGVRLASAKLADLVSIVYRYSAPNGTADAAYARQLLNLMA